VCEQGKEKEDARAPLRPRISADLRRIVRVNVNDGEGFHGGWFFFVGSTEVQVPSRRVTLSPPTLSRAGSLFPA
jgi:hypothetical protein